MKSSFAGSPDLHSSTPPPRDLELEVAGLMLGALGVGIPWALILGALEQFGFGSWLQGLCLALMGLMLGAQAIPRTIQPVRETGHGLSAYVLGALLALASTAALLFG